jgi:citrate synthase
MPLGRARTGRKRANDDAPYAAPSGAASALKRAANMDDAAAPRAKRKRLAPAPTIYAASYRSYAHDDEEDDADAAAEAVVRAAHVAAPEPRADRPCLAG